MTITRVNPAGWTEGVDNITATQANQMDENHTHAVDGVGGGTYAPASAINVGGSGVTMQGPLIMSGSLAVKQYRTTTATDVDNQTFGPTHDIIVFPTPGAARDHDLVAAGTTGRTITFKRPATGNFDIQIRRSGFVGNDIVTLVALQNAVATVFDDGTNWRLLHFSPQATPGADA